MGRLFSLRALVAAIYLLTVVPLLVGAGLLAYREYRESLYELTEARLRDRVHTVIERAGPPGPASLAIDLDLLPRVFVRQMESSGAEAYVLDDRGALLSPRLGEHPWLSNEIHAHARATGRAVMEQVSTPDGVRLVYLLPVRHPDTDRIVATAEASISLASVDAELAELRQGLTLAVAVALVLAFASAFVVAQLTTRPLSGLVATSHAVAQGDLNRRAALPRVTELRTLATTFNLMLERVQTAYQTQAGIAAEMHRFAADASHELRSPLAVLSNGTSVMSRALQHGDLEQAQEVARVMRAEVEGMAHLVDNLLFLARLEQPTPSRSAELTVGPLEPLPLLEEAYSRAELLVDGQSLRLLWPREPIHTIQADWDLVRLALNNVVANALHHTPPGKSITLTVEPAADGCRFVVEDEGSGIAPEHLPHIFERFYRGDEARTRDNAGSGLGLAIVQAIVAAHGGEIQVSSSLGQGTRVALRFPINVQRTFSGRSGPLQRPIVSLKPRQLASRDDDENTSTLGPSGVDQADVVHGGERARG